MSVIEAASAGFKDMADGTVRFFFDVEPRNAGDALRLFRVRGTPSALAALTVGHAAHGSAGDTSEKRVRTSDEGEQVADKPKGGALAKLAGQWCADPVFRAWASERTHNGLFWHVNSTEEAAEFVREMCVVESRADLDHNEAAAERFHTLIRLPYQQHLKAIGAVA
jgi:hypothetical protein